MAGAKITVTHSGPIRIEGDFAVCDPKGREFGLGGRTAIWLCRCGHSQDKPFCDGSHRRAEFRDEVQARDLPAVKP
jgi:CDGSH-type Zn-finger protein